MPPKPREEMKIGKRKPAVGFERTTDVVAKSSSQHRVKREPAETGSLPVKAEPSKSQQARTDKPRR